MTRRASKKREREPSGNVAGDALLEAAPARSRRQVATQPVRRSPTAEEAKTIMYACMGRDLAALKMHHRVLLVDLSKVEDEVFGTPLVAASRRGYRGVVKFLIAAGCDKNLSCSSGTPLCAAAENGHLDVVKHLISIGCDKEKLDKPSGMTPLAVALFYGKFEVVQYLVSAGCNVHGHPEKSHWTPLGAACSRGNVDVVKYLLSAGHDKGNVEDAGWSFMSLLARVAGLFRVRVAAHCNILHATNDWGRTALHVACQRDNVEMVKFLVEVGCRVSVKDKIGRTPLHLAAINDCTHVVSYLLTVGCEKEAKDVDGRTPLHLGALHLSDRCGAVEMLLAAGGNREARDNEGRTPLHVACSAGSLSMVKCLISRNCSKTAVDTYGCTPFFVALVDRRYDVMRILQRNLSFEKRLVWTQRTCSDVDSAAAVHLECEGEIYNDMGCLIRCDDTVTLPDGSVLDCKTAIARIVERTDDQRELDESDDDVYGGNAYDLYDGNAYDYSRVRRRSRALMSLSCLLRDGETVTLRNGRVLDNRICLVETLKAVPSRRIDDFDCDVGSHANRDELFLRLGILLRDPSETVRLADGRELSGQECLVESLAPPWGALYRTSLLYLGYRLKDNEIIKAKDGTLITKKWCFLGGMERVRMDPAIELKTPLWFHLGLLLLREENGAVIANEVATHHSEELEDELDAALCFTIHRYFCRCKASEFYLGGSLSTSKNAASRQSSFREAVERVVVDEDELRRFAPVCTR